MEATIRTAGALRARERDGVRFYTSPLLEQCGVPHAFSTRIGGVSQGPFDSLTLGSPAHHREPAERVLENWRRLLSASGCRGPVAEVHQVHAGAVVRVTPGVRWDSDPKADGIVSSDPARPIAVRVADCCPMLLARRDGKTVAAVHAGWRGVIAGVIEAAIVEMDVPAADLVAAVGPCIGFDAFEVGPEVLAAFEERFGDAPRRRDGPEGKGHVDLALSAVLALQEAGLSPERIDAGFLCTFERQAEFFSHRRDNGITGRMAAVIQPKP